VNIEMPQRTFLDLGLEVPEGEAPPSDVAKTEDAAAPADDSEPSGERPKEFQGARTFIDAGMEIPEVQRTMLEEPLEMPGEPGAPVQRTMLEDIEVPAEAGGAPAAPAPSNDETKWGTKGATGTKGTTSTRRGSGSSTSSRRVPVPSPAILTPGKYFGDYEVVSTLGEGAMGQVFKAKRRTDGLQIALKVMRGGITTSAKVRERFLREAKAAKMIDHPCVVRFIDAGMVQNDQFLAMEFVDGRSLQAVMNEQAGKPLPMARACELFRQICAGLSAAHAAGVIHRDLKPENILITRDRGIPKITDFGLARREEESMLLTRPGQIMGSPYYMAPEQGQGLPVDARADIYSLGAILFCLMTGRVPFPFPSATEVIHAHCELERPDPRGLNKAVSEELALFILKMLAISPDARPQTAQAALDEFEGAVVSMESAAGGAAPEPEERPRDPRASSDDLEIYTGPEIADALSPGTRVGRLKIEGVIGAGGMGAVYAARHDEGRVSALKVLPKKFASDAKRVKSFIREAELGKRIKSPNVAEAFDYGNEPALGVSYLELELVQGTSVENLIKTGVLQQESLLINILRGCAQGLTALHAAGILHRDVKPSNILLSGEFLSRPDGGVKLIDLGLAIEKENAKKAAEEEIAGTPLYMAPEQTMKGAVMDERSDLYSLGCAIYHLACGHPPFEGKSPQAIAYLHQRTSAMSPRKHNTELTEGFSAIIELLLAKNPDDRYSTAEALIADLARTDEEGKLKKPEIHAKYRTNRLGKAGERFGVAEAEEMKQVSRRLVIAAAVVLAVCALVFTVQIVGAMLKQSGQPQPPPPILGPNPPPGPRPPPPPPPPPGPPEVNVVQKKTEEERIKDREQRTTELKALVAAKPQDWLLIRSKYEALQKDYPDAPLDKIYDQLKDAVNTFEQTIKDATAAAEKARRSKSEADWAEADDNIRIAKALVSREQDKETLQHAIERIEKLRNEK
jgi:serine/threonine-protein kinase